MPSERKDPGDTVFTRIPSLASEADRFLVKLVSADLTAVYATRPGDCLFVECAEIETMRARWHIEGVAGPRGYIALPHGAHIEGRDPFRIVDVLESPDADIDRTHCVDEDVQRSHLAPMAEKARAHRFKRCHVGLYSDRVRGPLRQQGIDSGTEIDFGSSQHCDPGTFTGQVSATDRPMPLEPPLTTAAQSLKPRSTEHSS